MLWEWDENKSVSNKIKHGISFEEVKIALGKDDPINMHMNPSYPCQEIVVFRGLDGKIYQAATEKRGERRRLISAHRSRKMEKRYGP